MHLTIERCLSQRWKAESAQFREAMRNSRLIAQAEKEGKDLSTIDFGPSDPNAQPQVRPRQKPAQLLLQGKESQYLLNQGRQWPLREVEDRI